jgi:hypothetical protein
VSDDGELLLHRLVDALSLDENRLEQSAPVVGDHLAIDLPGSADAKVLDPLSPHDSGVREAPVPPSLDLVELAEDLVEGKLEGGIHGGSNGSDTKRQQPVTESHTNSIQKALEKLEIEIRVQ